MMNHLIETINTKRKNGVECNEMTTTKQKDDFKKIHQIFGNDFFFGLNKQFSISVVTHTHTHTTSTTAS